MAHKYPVVALCGSTRFKQDFLQAQEDLTLAGNIVLSVGFFSHADSKTVEPETEDMLSEMHKARIDMADSIFVVNRFGYIGESTAEEIAYAKATRKPVRYMYPET